MKMTWSVPSAFFERERLLKSQEPFVVVARLLQVADVIRHVGHAGDVGLLLGLEDGCGQDCCQKKSFDAKKVGVHARPHIDFENACKTYPRLLATLSQVNSRSIVNRRRGTGWSAETTEYWALRFDREGLG